MQSFCFAITSDGGHPVPSGSVFVGLITDQHEENLAGNTSDLTGAGWERGRIAVNTSSYDLHNIQPYSSLTCPPTLGVGGGGGGGDKALFCETLRHSSVSSAEIPVDPHV